MCSNDHIDKHYRTENERIVKKLNLLLHIVIIKLKEKILKYVCTFTLENLLRMYLKSMVLITKTKSVRLLKELNM